MRATRKKLKNFNQLKLVYTLKRIQIPGHNWARVRFFIHEACHEVYPYYCRSNRYMYTLYSNKQNRLSTLSSGNYKTNILYNEPLKTVKIIINMQKGTMNIKINNYFIDKCTRKHLPRYQCRLWCQFLYHPRQFIASKWKLSCFYKEL